MNGRGSHRTQELAGGRIGRGVRISLVVTVIIGLLVTGGWLFQNDVKDLRETASEVKWAWLLFLPLLTLGNLALRFLRWNFLLRRLGAYVPLRENLSLFAGSFAFIVTPLHLGEVVKAGWLHRHSNLRLRSALGLIVLERALDVLALFGIGLVLAMGFGLSSAIGFSAVCLGVLALSISQREGFSSRPSPGEKLRENVSAKKPGGNEKVPWRSRPVGFWSESVLTSFFLSVLAWGTASLSLWVALLSIGQSSPVDETVSVFAWSTPIGGMTLVPGGVGVTGSLMLVQLERVLSLGRAEATVAVILVRLTTFWFAAFFGSLALVAYSRRGWFSKSPGDPAAHFDEIAGGYDAEIPQHIRDHVIRRKIERMKPWLAETEADLGADIGCGHGWYSRELEGMGFRLLGVDQSIGQLRETRSEGNSSVRVICGEAGAIPLRSDSVDFAFCVNVLHHLLSRKDQAQALDELSRIVKPGGCLFVHEINVLNPVFRFYMGYLFPLLRQIDVGNEKWLLPNRMPEVPGIHLDSVEYFTFLPDFVPRPLFRWLLPLEGWLEGSRLRTWSAHYVAVYRKPQRPRLPAETTEAEEKEDVLVGTAVGESSARLSEPVVSVLETR